MEMPICCGRCDFNVSSLYCNRTGSEIDRDYEYRERLSDCPISELPEKYGRLIDADAMKRVWTGTRIDGDIGILLDARPTIVEAEGE